MAKNQLTRVGKKNQFTDVDVVLRDQTKKQRLHTYVDEIIRCKTKIQDNNDSIKSIRDAAIEELNINPKMFNSIVSLFYNNNFEEKRKEIEDLEAAINALMKTADE